MTANLPSQNDPMRFPAEKISVLGVGVSATSYDEVGEWLARRVSFSRQQNDTGELSPYICVTSVHGVMTSLTQKRFRMVLNRAAIVTPDGMPIVWALRSFGKKQQTRVYGPNLMLELCQRMSRVGGRVFLYGGRSETLSQLCERLLLKYPDLNIVGSYSPPFRELLPEEDAAVRKMIAEARPDLIFVGISTPKQEMWMASHRDAFPGAVMIGVGAAFDFHAGRVQQAPAWVQRHGLEWAFRLTREPSRLWKRYLLITPWFVPLWALQKLRLLNIPME